MNQILATHNDGSNNKKTVDINIIIRFFCIAIIIFGIVTISVSGVNLYKDLKEKKSVEEKVTDPEISIEQLEETIKISAKYEGGIRKIKYTWNDQDSSEIELNGATKIEREIEIINKAGENILIVEVIGMNGKSKEITQIVNVDEAQEPPVVEAPEPSGNNSPVIQWVIQYNENRIMTIATDDTELKYIKYQWDDDEATTINSEGTNKLEANIDIIRGQHKLVITTEDNEGNIATKSGIFKGVKKPEISAIKYGNTVEITVVHDMGLKKVEYIVNDKIYIYDENYAGYNENNTNLVYNVNLEEGENIIQVTAESLEEITQDTNEGTTATYKGVCVYTP